MALFSDRLRVRARFYDALASALDAGLTAEQSLSTLAESGEGAAAALAPRVARGVPLSEALAAEGGVEAIEVVVIEAGERAGRLPAVLRRLGAAFAARAAAVDRLVLGLLYPVLVLHAAVLFPPIFLWFRDGLGAYLGAVLPVLALVYGTLALLVGLVRGVGAPEAGKLRRDRLLLRLPGIAKAVRARALTDYAHGLAVLYASAVPMPETLSRAGEATENRVVRAAATRVAERVRRGSTLGDALAPELDVFPRPFVQAIAVGEAAGKLEEVLDRVEVTTRQDADRAILALVVTAGAVTYAAAAIVVAWVVVRSWMDILRLPDGL